MHTNPGTQSQINLMDYFSTNFIKYQTQQKYTPHVEIADRTSRDPAAGQPLRSHLLNGSAFRGINWMIMDRDFGVCENLLRMLAIRRLQFQLYPDPGTTQAVWMPGL